MSDLSDAEKQSIKNYAQQFKKRGTATPKNADILNTFQKFGLNTNNKIKNGFKYLAEVWPKGGGFPKKDTWKQNTIDRFGELPKLGM